MAIEFNFEKMKEISEKSKKAFAQLAKKLAADKKEQDNKIVDLSKNITVLSDEVKNATKADIILSENINSVNETVYLHANQTSQALNAVVEQQGEFTDGLVQIGTSTNSTQSE